MCLCVCSGSLFPPPFLLLLRIDNKSSPIFFSLPSPSLIMTSHQWAISVIKIKTVGSCTIFLFCLVDLFSFSFWFYNGTICGRHQSLQRFSQKFWLFCGGGKKEDTAGCFVISHLFIGNSNTNAMFNFSFPSCSSEDAVKRVMYYVSIRWSGVHLY